MILKLLSIKELNLSESWRIGIIKIKSLSMFEKAMTILWLLGPFIYLIERSPADAWLSILAIVFLFRSFIKKEWIWAKQTWFKLTLAFWLTSLLSALLSPDPYFTFSQGE